MDYKFHIRVLEEEIKVLKSRIAPHDTGHLYTTINTLQHRVAELRTAGPQDYGAGPQDYGKSPD